MAIQDKDEVEPKYCPVPQNVIGSSKRILKFPQRNWIEGIISVAVVIWIIWQIPFVLRVKIIVAACTGIAVLLLNLIGVRNMSISETCINLYKYISESQPMHLRSIKYAKKQSFNDKTGEIKVTLNESILERYIRIGKEYIQRRKN